MNELALFAGAGGGILGGHLLGWRTVCAVEWEAYPASVLVARQNDKILPPFPIWDDVQTFDGKPWRGIVDVVSGGFPCQDISAAGGGLELTEKEVECGERWQGLLARLDPNTHLWKIPQCSLLEDSEQSLETWPRWGTMQNGVCWEQPMLVQTIKETEFGSWPTPTASQMPSEGSILQYRRLVDNGVLTMEEAEGMLMASLNPPRMKKWTPNNETFFHTPNTTGLDGGSNSRKALKKRMADTPSGNWPTPTCADIYTDKMKSTQQSENSMHSVSLSQAVQKWPTPLSSEYKGNQQMRDKHQNGLTAIVGGQLNPMWVEWLMGWPIGWTDLKPLEMDKSHFVQQQPGQS
jgi:C-5 cytosine-specific DNA methylase